MPDQPRQPGSTRRQFLKQAAWAGLIVGQDAERLLAAIEPQTVTGTVHGDKSPLPGVRVSDGRTVVTTDRRGRFSLDVGPDSGHFLFVTTPRGFWSEQFFLPTAQAARQQHTRFQLRPHAQSDRFRFVFWTDMHLEGGGIRTEKFRCTVAETNRLKPAFVWAQGDICLQGAAGKDYLDCIANLQVPIRNGAGNHEMILDATNPRERFESLFGPTYYSFDWAGIHCVVLDGNRVVSRKNHWSSVHGVLSQRELRWLEADLRAKPTGMPVIAGIHIPLVTTYSARRATPPKVARPWVVANQQQVRKILQAHDTRLVLQGHLHENERILLEGIEHVESQAVAGSWWNRGKGPQQGVDHAPRGYRVVEVRGREIKHRFVSSCESRTEGSGQLSRPGQTVAPRKKTYFIFNCFDAPNDSRCRARIDQGPWRTMRPMPAVNQQQHLIMPHHYLLDVNTAKLDAGDHVLQVETDSQLDSFRQRVPFTVAPPGRGKIPVIYCTDLYHPYNDPDDHFDLATIFAIPEIDLQAVILDDGAKQKQSPGRVAVEQMMAITDRKVPVAVGLAPKLHEPGDTGKDQPAELQAGVERILTTLQQSDKPVTVVTVGSMRDVAAAYNREPELCARKIERLYAFIGDAHSAPDFTFREWNVTLDVHAFVAIANSGLPLYWVPCFDGGARKNAGHASFWRASHAQLLSGVSDRVKQYFIHALLKKRGRDPLEGLDQPVDPQAWQQVLAGNRNLWCCAVFTHLADRSIVIDRDQWHSLPAAAEATGRQQCPFTFEKVLVRADPTGMILYPRQPPHYLVERFQVVQPASYAEAMTALTAELLAGLGP